MKSTWNYSTIGFSFEQLINIFVLNKLINMSSFENSSINRLKHNITLYWVDDKFTAAKLWLKVIFIIKKSTIQK